MKKVKFLIAFVFLFVIGINGVNALDETTCSSDAINSAKNITAKYETKYEEIPENFNSCGDGKEECGQTDWVNIPPESYYYNLIVTNLTNGMYVEIINDYNKNFTNDEGENGEELEPEREVISADKFATGTLTYKSTKIYFKTNYTINVYSTSGNCLLKSIKLTTPLLNPRATSNSDLCKKIPDYKYCKTWVEEEVNDTKFYNEAQTYASKKGIDIKNEIPEDYQNTSDTTSFLNDNNNIKLILLSIVIIAVIAFAIISIKVWGKKK